MPYYSDGLFKARYNPTIDDLENASFGHDCGVGTLIENASHMTVALGGMMGLGYSRTLFVPRACANPGRELLVRGKCCWGSTDFGNDLLQLNSRPDRVPLLAAARHPGVG